MGTKTLRTSLPILIPLCIALLSCAPKKPPAQQPADSDASPASGASAFLDPAPDFKKGPEGVDLVYLKEGADLALYDKIMLDAVVFFPDDKTVSKTLHSDDIKKLSESFRNSVLKALGTAYPVVETPGPGVLRVRTAITRIVPNKPGLSAALAIIPGGSLAYALLPAKLNNIGSATMEGEILDSLTGERLGAAVAHRVGKKNEIFGISQYSVNRAFSCALSKKRVKIPAN